MLLDSEMSFNKLTTRSDTIMDKQQQMDISMNSMTGTIMGKGNDTVLESVESSVFMSSIHLIDKATVMQPIEVDEVDEVCEIMRDPD